MKEISKERLIALGTAAGAITGSYISYRYEKERKPLTFIQGQMFGVIGAIFGTIAGLALTNSKRRIWQP